MRMRLPLSQRNSVSRIQKVLCLTSFRITIVASAHLVPLYLDTQFSAGQAGHTVSSVQQRSPSHLAPMPDKYLSLLPAPSTNAPGAGSAESGAGSVLSRDPDANIPSGPQRPTDKLLNKA